MGNLSLYKFGIRFRVYTGDQTGKGRNWKTGGSLANTVHTNTTHKLYTLIVDFILQISVIHIDNHHREYRFGRKSATEEAPSSHSIC
jgi:hypothetical protein